MTTSPVDIIATGLLLAGCLFYLAGTIGLLRFPDVYCRLHALTKADNLGLGFISLGMLFQMDGWREMALVVLIWLLTLFAAGTVAQLVARTALRDRGDE
jgi:multicomponent Na+:H+ antiporter subunit G